MASDEQNPLMIVGQNAQNNFINYTIPAYTIQSEQMVTLIVNKILYVYFIVLLTNNTINYFMSLTSKNVDEF